MDNNYVSIDVHPNKGRDIRYHSAEDLLMTILLAVKVEADKMGAPFAFALMDFASTLALPEVKEQALQTIRDEDEDTLF